MDILAFFGSVWLAIFAGVFVIAMVVGCTFDRRETAYSAKWWIFILGLGAYTIYAWNTGYRFSWEAFWSSDFWGFLGTYLAIGLAYSILEFALDVRRSVRYWKEKWNNYRAQEGKRTKLGNKDASVESPVDVANSFVANVYAKNRIIGIAMNKEAKSTDDLIVPKIDRANLAEHIGCWVIFWPFYAVSLLIGDLVMELSRIASAIFAKIAGRFVRMSFANVFKF